MDLISIILFIIIIGSLLSIIYALMYNQFQNYIIKINIIEKDIDNTLRNKYDLLNKIIKIIENKTNEKIETELPHLKDEKLSNFELDRKLISITDMIIQLKDKYPELNNNKTFNNTYNELNETDEQLIAYKNYYNDNIIKFNKLIRMFPSNIVGKISRFDEKLFYDQKNMHDEDIKDFKL